MNFESNDPTGSSLPTSGRGAHTSSPLRLKCTCTQCQAALESDATDAQDGTATCCPELSPSAHATSASPALAPNTTAMAARSGNAPPSAAPSSTTSSALDRRTLDRLSLRDILGVGYTAPEMASTVYRDIAAAVSSFEALAGSVPVQYLAVSLGYKHAEQLLASGLSKLAVTRRLLALGSVVVRGKDRGLLPSDLACPFDPALRGYRQQRIARVGALPLRAADLQLLFSSSLYQYGHPDPLDPRAGRFWAPLVGLFTGARVSELESAQVWDIERREGAWTLQLGSDRRRAMNAWASRPIPLHPELVRCGFIAYAAQRMLAGQALLLPNGANRTAGHRLTPMLSRWYKQYVRAIGFQAGQQGMPSLRTTFMVALAQSELPRQLSSQMAGLPHRLFVPETDGRCPPTAARLSAVSDYWIRQLRFGGLELSHLYVDDPMARVEEAFPTRATA